MKKHILEAQLEVNEEPKSADPSSKGICSSLTVDADSCRCKHLQKWLPHVLNLSCIHDGDAWRMANPVHALHVASHLEADGTTVFLAKEQPIHGEPALYGEEQGRTNVVSTTGITHAICGHISGDTNDEEPYVTRTVVPREQPSEPAKPSSAPTTQQQKKPPPSAPLQGAVPPAAPLQPAMVPIRSQASLPPSAMASRPNMPLILPKSSPPPPFVGAQQGMPPTSYIRNPHLLAASSRPMPNKPPSFNPMLTPAAFMPPDKPITSRPPRPPPINLLTDERYQELRRKEHLILQQRFVNLQKRKAVSESKRKAKRQKTAPTTATLLPDSMLSSVLGNCKTAFQVNQDLWEQDARRARAIVEEWMERFRFNRNAYWEELKCGQEEKRKCHQCESQQCSSKAAAGDGLMQCLECSFIGCGPCEEDSKQHMMHHLLRTGHTFAVTCGERSQVYCFKCGDFVYHDVFDQERERIDISRRLPWMGWNDHAVQRSFDAMQFVNSSEHGVVWRGLVATYPSLVPTEHIKAARLSMQRLSLFHGELGIPSLSWGSKALEFAVCQSQKDPKMASRIPAPVGMYNLGNTCFMSCILQCLIHCVPLQRHFLWSVGHHYKSCAIVRGSYAQAGTSRPTAASGKPSAQEYSQSSICLACELDRLFLQYFGSSIGRDVSRAVSAVPHPLQRYRSTTPSKLQSEVTSSRNASCQADPNLLGQPLVTTDLLAAAWKSGGMDHLAGYDQRDAHEFLHAFLDTVGKHAGEYRKLIRSSQSMAKPTIAIRETADGKQDYDIIKQLFEGTLRSVLICEECGCKRMMPEPFLNVSLPLSKHVLDVSGSSVGTHGSKSKISLQRCLEHFTAPESLGDPVDCPSCKKKTPTKKQHTFAKLPKVLCLHLKRFDAAKNRKIADFVSFPASGLDMGRMLPHWCEASVADNNHAGESNQSDDASSPHVLYDLFASANHIGTLHQGHYVANVKVNKQWYHCNDAHVSKCDEEDVLKSEAYVLFYIRR